jgi:hypothetical protein
MRPLRSQPIHPWLAGALIAWSAAVVLSHQLPEVPQAVLVVGYLLTAPGLAVVPSFGPSHRLFHGLLVVTFSVALATGLSTTMSVARWWHVEVALAVTVELVAVVLVWRVWRRRSSGALAGGGVL